MDEQIGESNEEVLDEGIGESLERTRVPISLP